VNYILWQRNAKKKLFRPEINPFLMLQKYVLILTKDCKSVCMCVRARSCVRVFGDAPNIYNVPMQTNLRLFQSPIAPLILL
jgi:hypothetical protein